MNTHARTVTNIISGQATSDGAGVRLNRVIGSAQLSELDPFLLLDEFLSDDPDDYIAGFPDHPHRGFETVTYMLAGRMRHGDNRGNSGLLQAGSAQWMTAGRGIVHSEMPEQENGRMWGFQLWVNLPARAKMCEPRYQDIPPDAIPEVALSERSSARIVAGTLDGTQGPISGIDAEPVYFDLRLAGGDEVEIPLPAAHTAFVYCYVGKLLIGVDPGTALDRGRLAVLSDGDTVALRAGTEDAQAIVVAGRPFNEPVARYGPFVMNTQQELMEAIQDLRAGRF
jgi:redox-sensitive bicupin YhaK (pirin superfamily)